MRSEPCGGLESASSPKVALSALNNLLAEHGRLLWRSGHVYWKYSEILNAVTAKRRPLLGRAWNVAWTLADSGTLGSAACLALCWDWPRTATLMAAAWGGVLRPSYSLLVPPTFCHAMHLTKLVHGLSGVC